MNVIKSKSIMLASQMFPNEKWECVNIFFFIAKTRILQACKSSNEREKFEKEFYAGLILSKHNHFTLLIPENKDKQKNPDSIVDGVLFDFKQTDSDTFEKRLKEGIMQAGNVFINNKCEEYNIGRILGKLKKSIKFHQYKGCLYIYTNNILYHYNMENLK